MKNITSQRGGALVWIIILIVVVGGLYLFTKDKPADEAPTTETTPVVNEPAPVVAQTVTVNYSATGYSPAALTIKKGDTVKFVAPAGVSMWTASDPHPTHTSLAGFDQKGAGAEYSYTFTTVGTFGYHNHLTAAHKGTITVTE